MKFEVFVLVLSVVVDSIGVVLLWLAGVSANACVSGHSSGVRPPHFAAADAALYIG